MKETKWEIVDQKDCQKIMENGNILTIHMQTAFWAFVYAKSNLFPCEENKIYKFYMDASEGGTDFRVLIQFYGNDGALGYRRYITSGSEFCVPAGMNRFEITATISTRADAVVTLGKIAYEYVGEYQPRNVRMCAISDDMMTDEMKKNPSCLIHSYCQIIDEIVKKEKPDIIVLTETFHDRCVPELELKEKFIDAQNEAITRMAEKAKEHGIYICASYHLLEDDCRYNRALLFDRKGEIIAAYDKTHPTVMERDWGMKPGDAIAVVDTDIGRLGLIICYDLFFPEFLRMYHLAGCDILLCPTRGDALEQNHAAALNSGAFLVTASFAEMNRIYDRGGRVIGETGEKGYAVAAADINKTEWRPYLSVGLFHGEGRDVFRYDRRPDIYGALTEKI